MVAENIPSSALDTVTAGANLTGKETYLGTMTTGRAVVAAGATLPLYVIYQGAATGQAVTRQFGGIGRVICGGTVAAKDKLTSNASGQAITTTTAGNNLIGEALEAGVSGQVISVLVQPGIL